MGKSLEFKKYVFKKGQSLSLIPVIDLLDGEVVHAIAGDRSRYRSFDDSRFKFNSPRRLVELMIREFQPTYFYVADLNAILDRGNHLDTIRTFDRLSTRFLVDFGFRNWRQFVDLRSQLPEEFDWIPVFGTETVDSVGELADAHRADSVDCFLSLDVKNNNVVG